jgi:putative Ca2+/H+ antiporter (TMEM165/GDT1 family)
MPWEAFWSAFGLVFVAELGDKTQLAVLSQTCKFRSSWPVFVGASLALTVVTAIGAVAGQLLSRVIPAGAIQIAAGILFVIMGIHTWRESRRMETMRRAPSARASARAGPGLPLAPPSACSLWPNWGTRRNWR